MKYLYTKINNNHLNRNDMPGIVAGCTGCNIGKDAVWAGHDIREVGDDGKRDARSEPGMTYLV
jgi:hypothetical protein